MPWFYFDVMEVDGGITEDTVGMEIASEEEARRQANRALADMTAEEIHKGKDFRIRVRARDESGTVISSRQTDVSQRDWER